MHRDPNRNGCRRASVYGTRMADKKPKHTHPLVSDVDVTPIGTIIVVRPVTEAGEQWITKNCPVQQWQWFNGALTVDPRYIGDLVDGMRKEGLHVRVGGSGRAEGGST